jgi:RNA polymerase sigma-70 factor (ECF subfamily)
MAAGDAELVARTRAGETEAFGELVARYRDMVYGLSYHLTGDFEAARDLAQEAFVQAYLKLAQLREPERFAGWLRQIATNCYRSARRRREVATVVLEAAESIAAPQPDDTELAVRGALARLRAPERLALTLHYIDGYSHAEIAGFLSLRPETVKTRLARARQHLRQELMAMVEEAFRGRSLGEAFEHDVAAAVRALQQDVRRGLPEQLTDLARIVETQWQALLAEVRAALPEDQGGRAAAGEAIPVGELPEALREKLGRAVQWLWLDRIVFHLGSYGWDDDWRWVGLSRQADGQWQLSVWDSEDPTKGGRRSTTLPSQARRYRMSADTPQGTAPALNVEALRAALVADVRRAMAGLRAGINARLPAPAPEVYAEVEGQFERLGVAWFQALNEGERKRLESGERIRVGTVSEPARAALHRLLQVDWLRTVVVRLAAPPEWVKYVDECAITFEARQERTGEPGTKLERNGSSIIMGPDGVSAESSEPPEGLEAVGR